MPALNARGLIDGTDKASIADGGPIPSDARCYLAEPHARIGTHRLLSAHVQATPGRAFVMRCSYHKGTPKHRGGIRPPKKRSRHATAVIAAHG